MGALSAPAPLAPHHDVSRFSSGVPALDAWLQGKARLNEAKGGARTYVACDGERVAGFYSLAASAVERRRVSSRVGRNMPEPIPVIPLGQLAVDTRGEIADGDRPRVLEREPTAQWNAELGEKTFGGFEKANLERDVGGAGMLLAHVHEPENSRHVDQLAQCVRQQSELLRS